MNRSLPPYHCYLSQHDPLRVSLCDIFPTDKGFHVILGERTQGSLIHFFVVHYESLEPKISYIFCRRRGFRIPSCYGTLESLVYFQRNGNDCILTHMASPSGDLVDLYEYNLEQEEWISITLLNSPQARITSIALSSSQLLIKDNEFQGQFGRQILVSLSDGSILVYDKLNLKCKEQCFPMNNADLFTQLAGNKSEYFVRLQHTQSGTEKDLNILFLINHFRSMLSWFHSKWCYCPPSYGESRSSIFSVDAKYPSSSLRRIHHAIS